jgi:hypothetical protein
MIGDCFLLSQGILGGFRRPEQFTVFEWDGQWRAVSLAGSMQGVIDVLHGATATPSEAPPRACAYLNRLGRQIRK